VFVTELVAFFNVEGWSRLTDAKKAKTRGDFSALAAPRSDLSKLALMVNVYWFIPTAPTCR
jgi:hypothetical protein